MLKLSDTTWASLAIIGIGGFGTWHYSGVFLKAKDTDHWPTVPGQIVTSEYDYNPGTQKAGTRFAYHYKVDGQPVLQGRRVTWGNTWRSGPSLFKEGDSVSVYVNPENAKEAVLRPGTDTWTIVQILICLAVTGLGLWCLFISIVRTEKREK